MENKKHLVANVIPNLRPYRPGKPDPKSAPSIFLAGPSVFLYDGNYTIYMLVYTDDMVIIGFNQREVDSLLDKLSLEFTVMKIGDFF